MLKVGPPYCNKIQYIFFLKLDSEWPEIDFKHNFKKCDI